MFIEMVRLKCEQFMGVGERVRLAEVEVRVRMGVVEEEEEEEEEDAPQGHPKERCICSNTYCTAARASALTLRGAGDWRGP